MIISFVCVGCAAISVSKAQIEVSSQSPFSFVVILTSFDFVYHPKFEWN